METAIKVTFPMSILIDKYELNGLLRNMSEVVEDFIDHHYEFSSCTVPVEVRKEILRLIYEAAMKDDSIWSM